MGFRLTDLNPEQLQAVKHTEGPLLILAGAGTGKTRVITARIAWLLHLGVPPGEILAVTFTNKAANEMRERIGSHVNKEVAKQLTIGTFHAFCVRLLREGIEKLGYKRNFTIYDDSDQLGLIKKIITRVAAKDEKLDPHVAKNAISRAKNNGWTAPETDQTVAGAVFARYQQELKLLNAVDFDDLLLLGRKLLSEHADVRERLQKRYRYIMVDEFQDTNRLQMDIVSLLAGQPPNVCVVGDDDQSIYSWRGAEVANILEFERHFPSPKIVKLEQNYRSTNTILGAANSLIRNNPRRRPKSLWSEKGEGDRIRIIQMEDDRAEAEFLADEIERRHRFDQIPLDTFAVLYRMNAQSRQIEEALRRRRLPYRLIGGKSFFDRREVKDLIAYANAILNPSDDVSMLRIINTPPRGIGETTVELAIAESIAAKCSLFELLRRDAFLEGVSRRAGEALRKFADLIDRYETKLCEPLTNPADVLGDLLGEIGYFEDLGRGCKTQEEAQSRESNVRELLEELRTYCNERKDGLRGFLDGLALRSENEEKKETGEGITLITLHAAKGLEYPHVYLVGLEEGLLPHDRSKLEGTLDEERRLLYVGITRAMKTLTMSWCRGRMRYGSISPCVPSSFIKELDPAFVEQTSATEVLSRPVNEEEALSYFRKMRAMLETETRK
jgi:DNA helicase-2/ATP-dependent DNA helicase PcrA